MGRGVVIFFVLAHAQVEGQARFRDLHRGALGTLLEGIDDLKIVLFPGGLAIAVGVVIEALI